jgi:hypothetical protein
MWKATSGNYAIIRAMHYLKTIDEKPKFTYINKPGAMQKQNSRN